MVEYHCLDVVEIEGFQVLYRLSAQLIQADPPAHEVILESISSTRERTEPSRIRIYFL
jgi:hypothetical protein